MFCFISKILHVPFNLVVFLFVCVLVGSLFFLRAMLAIMVRR
jgi:hypothetical protein